MEKFDIVVIGGGPGGYVAAIKAAQNGAKTALIEKEFLGGTCLNQGCIPTKTLLASADIFHTVSNSKRFGVNISGSVSCDFAVMQKRKSAVVDKLRRGIGGLLKANKISVFYGIGSFESKKQIKITSGTNSQVIESVKTIIASGSAPLIPGFIPKGKNILDSTSLLAINEVPESLLILGGGVIGCEFACLFARLGTKVTVVEMLSQILPTQEKDVALVLSKEMKAMGIEILTGTAMSDIKSTPKSVSAKVGEVAVSAKYMLVSIGRKAVSSELTLENASVKTDDKQQIPVDSKCRTNIPSIYAIGDVTGEIQLAHMASSMGITAANNAFGIKDTFEKNLVPSCIFTSPEVASVGLNTQQCKEQNIEVNIGKFMFAGLGKALAIDETTGFIKIIADKNTDQVLGVHIVGPHATDLIAESATAMNLETTATELGKAVHAHPTLAEATMEAAHAVHGKCIHTPPPRKK